MAFDSGRQVPSSSTRVGMRPLGLRCRNSGVRVSPAAVSQQVRRLEQYLDTTLFQRMARGLALTEQGRDYLPELSAGFDLLGESTARLRARRADGVLTLTTLAAFANGWLLPRL